MNIRAEHESDIPAVRGINLAAFESNAETNLVDALRGTVVPLISLVAEADGGIVGHALFSPVAVHPDNGESPWQALALGPMAVLPSHQRKCIGSELVRAGLDECRSQGHNVVFVLGHPQFYPRFGFVPAPPLGLSCPWDVSDEVFMVAELVPGSIAGRTGQVRYHTLFDSDTA